MREPVDAGATPLRVVNFSSARDSFRGQAKRKESLVGDNASVAIPATSLIPHSHAAVFNSEESGAIPPSDGLPGESISDTKTGFPNVSAQWNTFILSCNKHAHTNKSV